MFIDSVELLRWKKSTFDDRLKQLEDLRGWLDSQGIDSRKTRLGQYIKFFQDRRGIDPTTGKEKVLIRDEDLDETLFILREVDEWLWIHKGFSRNPPEGYVKGVKKSLEGSALVKDDATQARNHQFELKIASYFLQAGCEIDISNDCDIIAYMGLWSPIFVECKRIHSQKQIPKRLKELAKQLKARYKSIRPRSCHGLAVIDVTKLVNPNLGLTCGLDRDEGRDIIRGLLRDLSDNYDFTSPFEGDNKVLSVWLHATIPCLHAIEREPSTRFSSLHIALASPDSPRFKILNELRKVFEVT